MIPAFRKIITFTLISLVVPFGFQDAAAFDQSEWNVRCWSFDEKRWEDLGVEKMTLQSTEVATKITNTSGIHKHAHFVFPAELMGDFVFTIDLKGGYELGFLNRAGKDEMLYVELGEAKAFETFELRREGTRFSIRRNGRDLPMVHFRFDYGEDFLITLAIKDGESAEIRSYALEQGE